MLLYEGFRGELKVHALIILYLAGCSEKEGRGGMDTYQPLHSDIGEDADSGLAGL